MRSTVDEKLQKTLNERIGQSFEMVSKQLEHVQKGLGEMQSLAQDVGGLKKYWEMSKCAVVSGKSSWKCCWSRFWHRNNTKPM